MKNLLHGQNTPDLDLEVDTFRKRTRHIRFLSLICALVSIIVCAGGGYLLDSLLDKKYFYTIIGLVFAFILMNISVIYLSKRYVDQERAQLANNNS